MKTNPLSQWVRGNNVKRTFQGIYYEPLVYIETENVNKVRYAKQTNE